jgi:hypothetical protein
LYSKERPVRSNRNTATLNEDGLDPMAGMGGGAPDSPSEEEEEEWGLPEASSSSKKRRHNGNNNGDAGGGGGGGGGNSKGEGGGGSGKVGRFLFCFSIAFNFILLFVSLLNSDPLERGRRQGQVEPPPVLGVAVQQFSGKFSQARRQRWSRS